MAGREGTLAAARAAAEAGLSVVPLARKDRPMIAWSSARERRAGAGDVSGEIWGRATGYAIVCGQISGDLEVLDVETHDALIAIHTAARERGLLDLVERVELGWCVSTPSRGWHLLYRCPDRRGAMSSQRLAMRGGGVLVETRGEGGYVVGAGSTADCYPSPVDQGWETTQGGPASIVTLTGEERDALLDLARSVGDASAELGADGAPPPRRPRHPVAAAEGAEAAAAVAAREGQATTTSSTAAPRYVERPAALRSLPGDDWIAREGHEAVVALLMRHGYHSPRTIHAARGPIVHLRRRGRGISDHAAVAVWIDPPCYVTVHSTSADLAHGEPLTPLAVLAQLEHGGDHSAAARALYAAGYGRSPRDSGPRLVAVDGAIVEGGSEGDEPGEPFVTIEDVAADEEAARGGDAERAQSWIWPIIDYARGTHVGEIYDWILATSIAPQPILAMGAAVAIWGCVLSRRAVTSSGATPALYHLATAPTGRGKDHPMRSIGRFFREIGHDARVSAEAASEAGYYSMLREEPASILAMDEAGMVLSAMVSPRAPSHVAARAKALLTLYQSRYDATIRGKSYAETSKNASIDGPALSVYATTTPDTLWPHLDARQSADGLLGRWLLWDVPELAPHAPLSLTDLSAPPPLATCAAASAWIGRAGAGDDVRPLIVQISPEAAARAQSGHAEIVQISPVHQRAVPSALSLAMILALARYDADEAAGVSSADEPQISVADLDWGLAIARRSADTISSALATWGGRSQRQRQRERDLDELVRWLRGRGRRRWVTTAAIARAWSRWTRDERTELLVHLAETGRIEHRPPSRGTSEAWRSL